MNPILIIYTGGTIGMIKNEETNSLTPVNFDNIYQTVPLLNEFSFQIDSISLEKPIDSSDICPKHWVNIAEIIYENYNKYDGFVILHGTDTMSYTASALSFMLNNLEKPVIITGSQLPIRMIRSDGRDNLITAIEIAAHKENNEPVINEVCIFFEDKLYRGNRTTKFSAEQFDAYNSTNYPILAKAGVKINYNYSAINKYNKNNKFSLSTEFDTNVALIKLYPGISNEVFSSILNTKNLKGVVIETFGSGNAPGFKWMYELIKQSSSEGVIFINVSQCSGGSVEMKQYEAGLKLLNCNVVDGKTITTEAAITKLMYALGKKLSYTDTVDFMRESQKGEM